MIIERNLTSYVVYSEDPVIRALEKITANKSRLIFCVDAHGHLDGALSDGDFRRWVSSSAALDVGVPALQVANRQALALPFATPPAQIATHFGPGIDLIPLVDDRHHLVAVAINRSDELRIGRHVLDAESPTLIISEIGINHQGSVDLARRLVDLSVEAGADIVKFQLRDLDALYRQGSSGSGGEDLGPQYTLDLLAKYNLDADQLFQVFDHCRDVGIDVMCTAWDQPSVDQLADYGITSFKVASADMTNHDLLRHMAGHGLPLIISTGMSTEGEIKETVDLVRATGTPFALLHCQSTYPAPFKDVNLTYLQRLAEIGQCPVGYSGHERGFHVPIAAVALGAKVIEKHFTIDRDLEGNDHKVSLLPEEFAEMVRRIREVEDALGTAAPRGVSTGEMMNRVNLAKKPGRRPRHSGRRDHRLRRRRHQEPRARAPAQRLRSPRRPHCRARPGRRRLLLCDRPRRRRAPRPAVSLPAALGSGGALSRHRRDDEGLHPGLPGVPLLLQGPRSRPGRDLRRPSDATADVVHHPLPRPVRGRLPA